MVSTGEASSAGSTGSCYVPYLPPEAWARGHLGPLTVCAVGLCPRRVRPFRIPRRRASCANRRHPHIVPDGIDLAWRPPQRKSELARETAIIGILQAGFFP
jgi:hypothetical protein